MPVRFVLRRSVSEAVYLGDAVWIITRGLMEERSEETSWALAMSPEW